MLTSEAYPYTKREIPQAFNALTASRYNREIITLVKKRQLQVDLNSDL